jgi:hypothetical protein
MTLIQDLLLDVMSNPTEVRIVIQTTIPQLDGEGQLYYMIDKGDCGCPCATPPTEPKVFDHWVVSNSEGSIRNFPTHEEVVEFVQQLCRACADTPDMWVESF